MTKKSKKFVQILAIVLAVLCAAGAFTLTLGALFSWFSSIAVMPILF